MLGRVVEDGELKTITDCEAMKAAIAKGTHIWIELEAQCAEADDLLVTTLHIHPLTIEDIWATRSQPKLEDYRNYLYLIIHALKGPKRQGLELVEVDVIIGKTFLITHDRVGEVSKQVLADLQRDPTSLVKGPAWVAHMVLDEIVDQYLPVVDELDGAIEGLTNDALTRAGTPKGPPVLRRILRYKRLLQNMRRMAIHQREIFLRVGRGEFEEIPRETTPFFRDVYDHFLRINDLVESYRDLVTSALEAYLTVQANRMNEIMKTLTMISTVMLPLTFIAGVYGMNFKHMPETNWLLGYPMALGLMAVIAVAILWYFRKKRWIGNADEIPVSDDDGAKTATKKKPAASKSAPAGS
ncbi:MAG TPA: magnesium/cobalt transporter CorA [Kofleriaceae bacterium]|nr:magnesium/cobalt transporter CorA [Kofleriaceae bacterium]